MFDSSHLDGQRARLSRSVRAATKSARQATAAIETHPYLAAGVVAGVCLAIGGAVAIRAYRHRSFFDVVRAWF